MRIPLLWSCVCLFVALGGPGPGRAQTPDLAFFTEIDLLVADGEIDAAERRLEAAFLGAGEASTAQKLDLLDALAELQGQSGKPGDRGDTLWNEAALIARESGTDFPGLAPVYAAAGDAYFAAGAYQRAVDAYDAALRIDRTYLACDSAALSESYGRYADALEKAGDAAAAEARRFADSADLRCAVPGGGRSVTVADGGEDGTFASVEVFYGTDRKPSGSRRPNDFYGGERGALDYGKVTVTIPRTHKPGMVETPKLLKFEWRENPALHVVLTDIARLDEDGFFATVAASLTERGSDEIFVFIHGFNMTFAETAKLTAQMAYDLNFEGVPMFYSWPSRGSARSYLADAASVQVSARHLRGFLEDVVARAGARRIHLIAHSMGSRALTQALELYAAWHPEAEQVFDQVIFAAPDVDAELFALQASAMQRLSRRITLYASSADVALSTSRALHGDAPRAGQGGAGLVVSPDFDTVDMTALGDDMLHHAYFATEASALADILWLFWRNPAPEARCGMQEQEVSAGIYWIYRSDDCNEQLILPAITLARRFGEAAIDQVDRMIADITARTGTGGADQLPEMEALHDTLARILH